MNCVDELIAACRMAGSDIDLVQGPGGNISIKDGKRMFVKASGFCLSEVSSQSGIASFRSSSMAGFFSKIPSARKMHEGKYMEALSRGAISGKPSMETGFHSVLGRAVVHTHPVAINSISCAKNGKEIALKAFGPGSFTWIPYFSPGAELARAIAMHAKGGNHCFILQNHGLIVASNSMQEALAATHEKCKTALTFLESEGVDVQLPSKLETEKEAQYYDMPALSLLKDRSLLKMPLFPDAAICCRFGRGGNIRVKGTRLFLSGNAREKEYANEVFLASFCTLLNSSQLSRPRFLKAAQVKKLLSMALERERMEAAR
ncbi:MAG TPA: class II aldolase/adducin family protein [Candidatus Diapherotrites archaeon]|uniref:Class II aldolase/adducin family protein n=1 Tax=Candidatus Iainarchaeum sp. TaxID=3101447 RepID=A0A7J4IYF5_9ARCH|nr:class II aldolase/adducin family protein [Candidatus Diapherotrites archaeon]